MHSVFTESKFRWDVIDILDLLCVICYIKVISMYPDIYGAVNDGLGLMEEPSESLMFATAYINHISVNEFNISFYFGLLEGLIFIRLLLVLRGTELLGPIISTIMLMFHDISIFLVIWSLVLVCYCLTGNFFLGEAPALFTIPDAFIYFVETSFGNIDFFVFDFFIELPVPRPFMRYLGIAYVISFVVIQFLILVNIVIAMMADTYSQMTSFRPGLHNYHIVSLNKQFKFDKVYGPLHYVNPLSIVTFFLIFCYINTKSRKSKKVLSHRLQITCFVVVVLPMEIVLFMAINLILSPFAYLKICHHKFKLARKGLIPTS